MANSDGRTAIICVQEFTAGGITYAVGHEVKPEHTAKWNRGDLTRRLVNLFVEYKTVDDDGEDAAGAADGADDETTSEEEELASLTKQQLSDRSQELFGKSISKTQNADSMLAEYLDNKATHAAELAAELDEK